MRKPVFLDRDGVINHDFKPYITKAEQIELIDGAAEGLAILDRAGYDIYVTSNQQGVAKGFISPDELPRMNSWIQSLLRPHGVQIRHFEYCTAMEGDGNPCRKPSPGMIHHIRDLYALQLSGCWMVGDRWSDVAAGKQAGLNTALVLTGVTKPQEWLGWEFQPDTVWPSLKEAAAHIAGIAPTV